MACRGCSSSDGCGCSVVGSDDGVITFSGSGTPITSPYEPEFHGDVWLDGLTEDNSDPGDLNDPYVPVILGDGSVVKTPLPDPEAFIFTAPIPGNAFAFTYDGTTTDADPGDGFLRLNNGTPSSVTQIYVDLSDFLGSDVSDWLDSLDDIAGSPKGRIRLYSRANQANWIDFKLTGWTTAVGYRKFTVVYVDHDGALTTDTGDTVFDFAPAADIATEVNTITFADTPYTVTILEDVVLVNTTGGDVTVNLPAAATAVRAVHIKKLVAANTVTIDPDGAETIDGSSTVAFTAQYESVSLVSDGSNWHVI